MIGINSITLCRRSIIGGNVRELKESADHDDYSLVHMSKAIGWKHNAEFASCCIYYDKGARLDTISRALAIFWRSALSTTLASRVSLPMKRIMSSIWFALAALLLSLACVGGALHLGRTELWAHGVAKAETAPSSPNGSDSQQTEAGGQPSTTTAGLLPPFPPRAFFFL